jgi:hypothetical protein
MMVGPLSRLPIAALGRSACALVARSQRWLMLGILVLHALLLPHLAVQPRAVPGSRETEHEVRIETVWRGAADQENHQSAAQSRRAVAWWAEVAARRPMSKSRVAVRPPVPLVAILADLENRNGTGGPLRC